MTDVDIVADRLSAPSASGSYDGGVDRLLAQDLLDALWLEDLYGFRARALWLGGADADRLAVPLGSGATLQWHGVRLNGMRPLRLARTGASVHRVSESGRQRLSVGQTLDALQRADWWPAYSDRLAELLTLAERQIAKTFAEQARWLADVDRDPYSLMTWESICCLRDRPFHPVARAKLWPGGTGDAYEVEVGRIPLRWVAVLPDALRYGDDAALASPGAQPVARAVLDKEAVTVLAHRAASLGIAPEALWLPVHPWQWDYLQHAHPQLTARCIDFGIEVGVAQPTASLRTLGIGADTQTHLKLSLSVQALGASRVMPPRYLHNAVLAERCLRALCAQDTWLGEHLELCDERAWWSLGNDGTLIEELGELACMLRRYPDGAGWLLPMAACAASTTDGRLPAFAVLCGANGADVSADTMREDAWRMFERIARLLIELGLRCFAHGVMPELHGQNVLLRVGPGGPCGIVLRDHDTLRICPSTMVEAGVEIPDYAIDRSTPNTLILDTPDALLAYFQTLAVEVNLYAIIAALADRLDDDERTGWVIVDRVLCETLDRVFGATSAGDRIARALFDTQEWPFKQLLAPLAARATLGTGMPSGLGTVRNPLHTVRLQQPVTNR
ncbi:siderophore biosynthesis protein [Burkholderia contaminans]|uniref:IucA/IucC family protein n=1 Tax=Burkholderia contaminans TaxID=488447 RepID=UPI001CF1448A|nr:IucA/IucC family protein [Burkholderia contaminans]MCA7915957.1 siderophore biosynthesis protein [Burkholderia contaminans]UUX40646.1 siderophore biosynthesis protein [Burkholderia contaminans]